MICVGGAFDSPHPLLPVVRPTAFPRSGDDPVISD
jgi:hypothetical protein